MIDLTNPGPSHEAWITILAPLEPFEWPDSDRLVVVSPHPDDETLGAGGLIATAAERNLPVAIVSVTDGEAAYPHPGLAALRRAELTRALDRLGGGQPISQVRLGLPDGAVTDYADTLGSMLASEVSYGDLVVCPLPDDGHPDHAATSLVATQVARRAGTSVRWFPVWAWHCHDPAASPIGRGQCLHLSDRIRLRKQAAIRCYRSQIAGVAPVVPSTMLRHFEQPFEVLIPPRNHHAD